MREIKFRAFCYDDKMVYWELGQEEPNFNEIASGAIMQYTGLKDKKGVEIYESDIFLHEKKGEFVITYQDANFRLVDKRTNKSLSAGCINLSGKVIGNIYQSPELLNA